MDNLNIRHMNFPYPNTSDSRDATQEIEGAQRQFRSLPTPSDVLTYGLVGVPKIFPMTGEEISQDYIATHLESAIQELEFNGLNIKQRITYQAEDMYEADLMSRFQPFKLNNFPVLKIESIQLCFANSVTDTPYATYTLPPEWYFFERTKVNIVATTGAVLATFSGFNGTSPWPFAMFGAQKYRPAVWKIAYLCGFENDKLPSNVWTLIIDKATLSLLNDIGPMMFPTSTYNTGIDSVSQSVALPGPKVFQQRIKALEAKIRKNQNTIISYYGGSVMTQFAGR